VSVGSRGVVVLVVLLVPFLSCSPPPLTESVAERVLLRARFAEPIYTTYLNPRHQAGCLDRTRYLVHCENAGLVKTRWIHQEFVCGEFAVELTEKGRQYFTGLEFVGRRDLLYTSKGWQASLRMPITARLIEVTGIEELPDGRCKVAYTWTHDYPPELEGCTRHSQAETYDDEAVFVPGVGRWSVEPRRTGGTSISPGSVPQSRPAT
jgi:hypothetical protein